MPTVHELCYSDTAREHNLINRPNPEQEHWLRIGIETVLEPIEALVGPIRSTSGFRCEPLNQLVKGEPDSMHMRGQADDFVTEEMDIGDAFQRVAASAVPYDQLIFEVKRKADGTTSRWIHVSWTTEENRRRQALKADLVEREDGTVRKHYSTYVPPINGGQS